MKSIKIFIQSSNPGFTIMSAYFELAKAKERHPSIKTDFSTVKKHIDLKGKNDIFWILVSYLCEY